MPVLRPQSKTSNFFGLSDGKNSFSELEFNSNVNSIIDRAMTYQNGEWGPITLEELQSVMNAYNDFYEAWKAQAVQVRDAADPWVGNPTEWRYILQELDQGHVVAHQETMYKDGRSPNQWNDLSKEVRARLIKNDYNAKLRRLKALDKLYKANKAARVEELKPIFQNVKAALDAAAPVKDKDSKILQTYNQLKPLLTKYQDSPANFARYDDWVLSRYVNELNTAVAQYQNKNEAQKQAEKQKIEQANAQITDIRDEAAELLKETETYYPGPTKFMDGYDYLASLVATDTPTVTGNYSASAYQQGIDNLNDHIPQARAAYVAKQALKEEAAAEKEQAEKEALEKKAELSAAEKAEEKLKAEISEKAKEYRSKLGELKSKLTPLVNSANAEISKKAKDWRDATDIMIGKLNQLIEA